MTRFINWKSGAAAMMAMAITTGAIAPMFALAPANAQIIRGQSRNFSIPAGFVIPTTYDKEKILVTSEEKAPITLKVAKNLVDPSGNIIIAEGTEIVGQMQPASRRDRKGSRFEAQELVFPNGNRQSLNATSQVITRTEKIKKGAKTGDILKDAAIGAGAASVISLLTGNRRIEALEPIIGAGAGAVASILLRKNEAEVVVVEPQEGDLDLTLRSSLQLSRSDRYNNY
ncbi:conjugal transfer protein TrbI [Scytonema sp. UIC 10036]|uniref:NAD(P)/FAD-dependent oxidoreductase n=1 Tax=Scytonema sp. UIC 10036 TaxID=2304196 RepID=UPI0012DA8772|nr:NAD(P)/FAD-dependent oxidoreductase [Scytonema sp. UIC 10036]MUG90983.1 conjugal transfer protein TrbI [Scytonema sp. UIC 10036]